MWPTAHVAAMEHVMCGSCGVEEKEEFHAGARKESFQIPFKSFLQFFLDHYTNPIIPLFQFFSFKMSFRFD